MGRPGDGQSVGDHKLGAVVARQRVEQCIVEIGGWGAGGIVRLIFHVKK